MTKQHASQKRPAQQQQQQQQQQVNNTAKKMKPSMNTSPTKRSGLGQFGQLIKPQLQVNKQPAKPQSTPPNQRNPKQQNQKNVGKNKKNNRGGKPYLGPMNQFANRQQQTYKEKMLHKSQFTHGNISNLNTLFQLI